MQRGVLKLLFIVHFARGSQTAAKFCTSDTTECVSLSAHHMHNQAGTREIHTSTPALSPGIGAETSDDFSSATEGALP